MLILHAHHGHPLVRDLWHLISQVEDSRAAQSIFSIDADENDIILYGVPSSERKGIIITMYYPHISDLFKRENAPLVNPNDWDFFVYLEK